MVIVQPGSTPAAGVGLAKSHQRRHDSGIECELGPATVHRQPTHRHSCLRAGCCGRPWHRPPRHTHARARRGRRGWPGSQRWHTRNGGHRAGRAAPDSCICPSRAGKTRAAKGPSGTAAAHERRVVRSEKCISWAESRCRPLHGHWSRDSRQTNPGHRSRSHRGAAPR